MFSRTAKRRMLAVVAVLAAVFVVAVVKARLIGQKPFRSWGESGHRPGGADADTAGPELCAHRR